MAVPIAELFVQVGASVDGALSGLSRVDSALKNTAANLTKAGATLSAGVTVPLVGGASAIAAFGIGFEDAFTAVRKTVDETTTDINQLRGDLIKLSTSPLAGGKSAEQLAGIAAAAGSLGIEGADNILEFTRIVAGMSVATGLAEEQLGKDLAAIALTTRTPREAYENLASTIVDLGNRTAATEGEIIEMTSRLAGTLSTLNVPAQNITGIAATLAELKINPEAGGTAISKFFTEMTDAAAGVTKPIKDNSIAIREAQDRITDLRTSLAGAIERQSEFGRNTPKSVVESTAAAIAKYQREIAQAEQKIGSLGAEQKKTTSGIDAFAKVAGTSVDEIRALIKTDPTAAFQKIISGLARIREQEGPAAALSALDQIGVDDVRMKDALLRLSQAPEQLTRNIGFANTAWDENRALQVEVAKAMESTTNQFNLLVNELKAEFIPLWESELKPIFTELTTVVREQVLPMIRGLVTGFSDLDEPTQKFILGMGLFAAALGPAALALALLVPLLAVIASPLFLLIALVGALGVAWVTNFQDIQGKTAQVVATLQGLFLSLKEVVLGTIVSIIQQFARLFQMLGSALPGDAGLFFQEQARNLTGLSAGLTPTSPAGVGSTASGQAMLESGATFNAPIVSFGSVVVDTAERAKELASQVSQMVMTALIESEKQSAAPVGQPLPGDPFALASSIVAQ